MIQKRLLVCALLLGLCGCSGIQEMEPAGNDDNQTQAAVPENDSQHEESTENSASSEIPEITVYTYDQDFFGDLSVFEEENHCHIHMEVATINGYASMLGGVLENSETEPDLMVLGLQDMKEQSIRTQLLSVQGTMDEVINDLVPYTLQQIKEVEGGVYAVPLDINPVVIVYRRSLALEVFGTEDESLIEAYFNSYDTLLQAAEQLKQKGIKLFPDRSAFRHFADLGKTPWFNENGFYVRDTKKWEFLDTLNQLRIEGYTANAVEWSTDWFAGMKDELEQPVFAYVLPSWGLKNILLALEEADTRIGDFAMIDGMLDHTWGGSYLAINQDSQEQSLALELIKYILTDVAYLDKRVEETGLVSANPVANEMIIAEEISSFLGQRDFVDEVTSFGKEVSISLQTDPELQRKSIRLDEMFQELITDYLRGEFHTADEALSIFDERVRTEFPEIFAVE